MDRLIEYINTETNADVYGIPGVTAFLQHPKKAIEYINSEMKIGISLSVAFLIAALYKNMSEIGFYYQKSLLLAFSFTWFTFINVLAILPKMLTYKQLSNLSHIAEPHNLRQAMIRVFQKRFYQINMQISTINTCSFLLSVPITVVLWHMECSECFDLLLYSMIYIIRAYIGQVMFTNKFLEGKGNRSEQNPHGFREIIYRAAEVSTLYPRLEGELCAICMDNYNEDDKIFEFSCLGGHFFHQDCLNDWMKRKATCPLCKTGAEY